MIDILVDNKPISARKGDSLLSACLKNGIYIPHLCHLEGDSDPPAACRLCFVEIDGERAPVTACTVPATPGLTVRTDTPAVRRLQRAALRLLLSVHDVDCKHCPANRRCELQHLARFLEIGLKPPAGLDTRLKPDSIDQGHPVLDYHPNRCVLCERCLGVCRLRRGQALFSLARRGFDTVISFHGLDPLLAGECGQCLACARACPVGALTLKDGRLPPPEPVERV